MESVTIGIPCFGRMKFLQEAFTCAVSQTYPNFKILLCQNPSNNELGSKITAWCEEMAAKYENVRFHLNERNLGQAGNFNRIAELTDTPYLYCLGDDDRIAPDFLSKMIPLFEEGYDSVFCDHHLIDDEGNRLKLESEVHQKRYSRDQMPSGNVVDAQRWAWRNALPMISSIYRTDVFREVGLKEDSNQSDLEFSIRLAGRGGRFYYVTERLAEYRIHPGMCTAAGLRQNRIVKHLLEIEAEGEMENYKTELLSRLLPGAVHWSLIENDSNAAGLYLKSKYFPESESLRGKTLLMRFCAFLPGNIGAGLYQFSYKLFRSVKKTNEDGMDAFADETAPSSPLQSA